jgi:Cu+-exporting ATPase
VYSAEVPLYGLPTNNGWGLQQNFIYASIYNIALVPLSAGAFYSLNKTRLPPVWAALAMALSSVTVVLSSLLLRTFRPPKVVKEFGGV